MQKFKKIGEFYTEDSNNNQKIKDALASIGYAVCWLDEFGDGDHFVIMEEITNDRI